MKPLIVLTAVVLAGSLAQVQAQKTDQQNLMGTCNTEAKEKDLKGDERKAFMKTCLSDGRKRQQERMKTCNAEVKGKKGEERKTALSDCLKN